MSGRWVGAIAALALACALAGCKGLGRELVGQRQKHDRFGDECEPLPNCTNDPLPETPLRPPPSAAPVELFACGGRPARIGCTSASGPIAGGGSNCEQAEAIEDENQGADALAQVVCDSVHFRDSRSAPAQRVLRVMSAHLQDANVTLESDLPLTVEFIGPALARVWFELAGPVTLRFEDTLMFEDVRVSSAGSGPAAVELESVSGGAFAVGADIEPGADSSAPARFAGDVAIWRSRMERVRLEAETSMFESDALADLVIDANVLQATDATLRRMQVHARHLQLSSCTIESGDFGACETFSALTGELRDSRIAPCEKGARLYGVQVRKGSIDGELVLDRADLLETRLGLHQPTDIKAWDTGLSRVRFCREAPSITFGGMGAVSCTNCDTSQGPCGIGVCVLTMAMLEVSGLSECSPAFTMAAEMPGASPACVQPEPVRMRPPLY